MKKVFVMIVFGMINIYKEYIKMKKKMTLANIFAYNSKFYSKSVSFSHAGTHYIF